MITWAAASVQSRDYEIAFLWQRPPYYSKATAIARAFFLLLLLLSARTIYADWPMLRGDPAHTGFVQAELKAPFRLSQQRLDITRATDYKEPCVI
jgi:hypothetical protein